MDRDNFIEKVSIWNSYSIIVGEFTLEDITKAGEDSLYFSLNPFSYTKKDIQHVIDYLASIDKFEECAELQKIKEKHINPIKKTHDENNKKKKSK
jgi:hypothetical protein